MITLLASISGFLSSIFPEFLKLMRDKNDKLHELAILDRQIEFSKLSASNRLEEIFACADIAETVNLYSTYRTGIGWVDALNGTVRPVIAYSFFLLYAVIKVIQYRALPEHGYHMEYLDILWSIEDQAIFAGVISFYFGQRTFSRLRRLK